MACCTTMLQTRKVLNSRNRAANHSNLTPRLSAETSQLGGGGVNAATGDRNGPRDFALRLGAAEERIVQTRGWLSSMPHCAS